MAKFIDRISERATLEEAWAAGKPELIVLHGRRRVGKSALLARFARNRPVAYFVGRAQLGGDQVAGLGSPVGPPSAGFRAGRPPGLGVGDWDEPLSVVVGALQPRRIGLVLDEFP